MYTSRLFTVAKLRDIAAAADTIADQCVTITDALSMYEQAGELTGEERTDAREDARTEAWQAMGELLAYAEEIRVARDALADPDWSPGT